MITLDAMISLSIMMGFLFVGTSLYRQDPRFFILVAICFSSAIYLYQLKLIENDFNSGKEIVCGENPTHSISSKDWKKVEYKFKNNSLMFDIRDCKQKDIAQ